MFVRYKPNLEFYRKIVITVSNIEFYKNLSRVSRNDCADIWTDTKRSNRSYSRVCERV